MHVNLDFFDSLGLTINCVMVPSIYYCFIGESNIFLLGFQPSGGGRVLQTCYTFSSTFEVQIYSPSCHSTLYRVFL